MSHCKACDKMMNSGDIKYNPHLDEEESLCTKCLDLALGMEECNKLDTVLELPYVLGEN